MIDLSNINITTELNPDRDKRKKQMSYADSRKIPFDAFIWEEEMKSGKVKRKDMKTVVEEVVDAALFVEYIEK